MGRGHTRAVVISIATTGQAGEDRHARGADVGLQLARHSGRAAAGEAGNTVITTAQVLQGSRRKAEIIIARRTGCATAWAAITGRELREHTGCSPGANHPAIPEVASTAAPRVVNDMRPLLGIGILAV